MEKAVFVISKDGKPLMPTYNNGKVRKMLKNGRAKIYKHEPFTIQLQYGTTEYTQEVEYCTDTGYEHVGISIKSEKHEYVHMQADMLSDEKKRREDRKKSRRTRRNRLRYRKKRFDNRKREKGWIPPSLQHRMDAQVGLFDKFREVCPITSAVLEAGKFDTQALGAIEAGKPLPEGKDYQQGPRYKSDTLREAVFHRDGYTCQAKGCGKSPFNAPGTILVIHHALFWRNDHTDRIGGLMTLCTGCHTAANHQKGGILWGLEPAVPSSNKAAAAFMNIVRWKMYDAFKLSGIPVRITYGAVTKRVRLERNIQKTHANPPPAELEE